MEDILLLACSLRCLRIVERGVCCVEHVDMIVICEY